MRLFLQPSEHIAPVNELLGKHLSTCFKSVSMLSRLGMALASPLEDVIVVPGVIPQCFEGFELRKKSRITSLSVRCLKRYVGVHSQEF